MASSSIPDIVIGIDFGMTCTGVAYSMAPEWPAPRALQHWDTVDGRVIQNKVSTAIAYSKIDGSISSWGFEVDPNQDVEVHERFKLFLKAGHYGHQSPPLKEVEKWFQDYMSCIYRAVQEHFVRSIPRWESRKIAFVFSVPTEWRDPGMIDGIEKLLTAAGFGSLKNHSIKITLTEAEAAAVSAAKESGYMTGDVLLVCDAGGGTTDINMLKVEDNSAGRTHLRQLTHVEGKPIGSTEINDHVESEIKALLTRTQSGQSPLILSTMDIKMMRDKIERYKCSFGSKALKALDLHLPIPSIGYGVDLPEANVKDSRIVIPGTLFQDAFDKQVKKICLLIDDEIENMHQKHPHETISYLVLSGGLGSSDYLKERLKTRYETTKSMPISKTGGIKVLTAAEPQLVVCNGLVMDHVQEIQSSSAIFRKRCCRNSYGVITRERYDPDKHRGEEISLDRHDKSKWIENQISWLIKRGDTVSVKDGIWKEYRAKIDDGQQHLPWKTEIVMSSLPVEKLQRSMKQEGVRHICSVEVQLDEQNMKKKNKHWYNIGQKYYLAIFSIHILIGAADMKFQVLIDGELVSKDHDQVKVLWNTSNDAVE